MQRALELAALGRHTTPPNPSVGCVVTQGERIVGEGWHRKWGEPHAEPLALQAAGAEAKGSTVYVTLEPHSYQSRTPPCTDALIRAGVRRVVIGVLDANPKVSGDGVRQLQAAGIDVQVGVLAEAARELNLGFEKRMTTGLPRVIVKCAISLDGRIALANGESKWITGAAARADVQRLRSRMSAVMTGVGTVLADDPQLNVRDPAIEMLGRQPLRVVLDSKLRMPPTAAMLKLPGTTLVFTGPASPMTNAAAVTGELQRAGAEVRLADLGADGRSDLNFVLQELGRRLCNDVLIEAGPTLVGQVLSQGLADEIVAYVAPVLLGPQARAMADLPALQALDGAQRYTMHSVEPVGEDVRLILRPRA
ncbi:MAG: bifunctional diaminohydroxyphosphoribosylaminopyrimidine deaminase/5-amino-6-(5-phosphoribosylamino)uracil reductase RibD [Steroidobacter sp.]|nr:bifunctional diaminohydroxyphosphoribosylaminopyrimidine deaminase/5-amino-6-(5-phosphoribosylamino)uracil reductase RibD [Steroidobacter sp.]